MSYCDEGDNQLVGRAVRDLINTPRVPRITSGIGKLSVWYAYGAEKLNPRFD